MIKIARLRNIEIIGAAVGCGAPDQRTQEAADWLRERGLEAILQAAGLKSQFEDIIRCENPASQESLAENRIQALPAIADFSNRLAKKVRSSLTNGKFPVIVGGDHSCAIGTWSGIKAQMTGSLGLLWLDAHMDSHTSETTESGAVHGMPLASLLGYGDRRLTEVAGPIGKLNPQHVALMGIRSFEAGEETLLKNLGVRIFSDEEIKTRGFQICFQDALAIVQNGTQGFGMSLDLDGFDPRLVPAVGSPVRGGFTPKEVLRAFSTASRLDTFSALEIVEYNPFKDLDWKTFYLICDLIEAALGERMMSFEANSKYQDNAVS